MPAVRAEGEQTRRGHEVAIRLGTIRKCGWECWRNRRFGHGWPATFSARSASFEVALLGHGSHGVHGQWPVCRRSGEASDMDLAMSDVLRFRRQTPHSPCLSRLPCPNSATSKSASQGFLENPLLAQRAEKAVRPPSVTNWPAVDDLPRAGPLVMLGRFSGIPSLDRATVRRFPIPCGHSEKWRSPTISRSLSQDSP